MKYKLLFICFIALCISVACTNKKQKEGKKTPSVEVQKTQVTQRIKVHGQIIDSSSGKPVKKAFIIVAGTNTGTISDMDAKFSISAPCGAKKLAISADNYESVKVDIESDKEMIIKLIPKKN
jgi:hypothetical protein